jgi:hypothetical protein
MGNVLAFTNFLITLAGDASEVTEHTGWSLNNFFANAKTTLYTLGSAFLCVLGVVMIVVAGVKIGKGLMGGQNSQPPNWVMTIVLLLVGGAFAVGGISLISDIASGGQQTIKDLGNDGGSTESGGAIIFTVDGETDYFADFDPIIQIPTD